MLKKIRLTYECHKDREFEFADGFNIILGSSRSGKQMNVKTPILTPDGWKKLGSVKVGDKVIGGDGRKCNVIGVYPQGISNNYKITFHDGTTTNCGLEHQWATITSKGFIKVRTLREMLNHGLTRTKLYGHQKKFGSIYRIPTVEAIDFSTKQFVIPPYILGVLIGDGSLVRLRSWIGFSCPNKKNDIRDKVEKLLCEDYYLKARSVCKSTTCPQYSIQLKDKSKKNQNIYKNEIKRYSLNVYSPHKFIPDEYMLGSAEQRFELLRGLMDTDGTFSKNGSASFCTTSKRLANNVVDLIRSLGGLAWLRIRNRDKENKSTEYKVTCTSDFNPFYEKGKATKYENHKKSKTKSNFCKNKMITSVERQPDCESVCIRVDNDSHTFVVENYIVTHNSSMLRAVCDIYDGGIPADAIPHDSKSASITAEFFDGTNTDVVGLSNNNRVSGLIVNGEEKERLGGNLPLSYMQAIGQHNLVLSNDETIDVTNIQQFSPMFFVDHTDGERLKIANAVFGLPKVDGMITRTETVIKTKKTAIKTMTEEKESWESKIEELEKDVKKKQELLSKSETVVTRLTKANDALKALLDIKENMDRLESRVTAIKDEIKRLSRVLPMKSRIEGSLKDLEALWLIRNDYVRTEKRVDVLWADKQKMGKLLDIKDKFANIGTLETLYALQKDIYTAAPRIKSAKEKLGKINRLSSVKSVLDVSTKQLNSLAALNDELRYIWANVVACKKRSEAANVQLTVLQAQKKELVNETEECPLCGRKGETK